MFSTIETSVITEVMAEVERAMSKHGSFPTIHHGVAVLDEEFMEFKAEAYRSKVDGAALRKECIHVAAVAIRFLLDIDPHACEGCDDQLLAEAEKLAKLDGVSIETMFNAMKAATETQQPTYVHRPDGTRRVLLPTPTIEFKPGSPYTVPGVRHGVVGEYDNKGNFAAENAAPPYGTSPALGVVQSYNAAVARENAARDISGVKSNTVARGPVDPGDKPPYDDMKPTTEIPF